MADDDKTDLERRGERADTDNSRDGASARRKAWNTDELYFDRNGRLIVKNRALARAIARAVIQQGGLTVHVAGESDGRTSIIDPKAPPTPVPVVPPWPNYSCPDMLCGMDLNLTVKNAPAFDPPRDPSWERIEER